VIAWFFAVGSLLLAALPALVFLRNLALYRPPAQLDALEQRELPAVSVLIPARNEEARIEAAVEAALAQRGVGFEVLVLDDHSTDRTAELVEAFARHDSRIRLERSPTLPASWCGKQHACWTLAQRAQHPWLLFVDADVRLAPDAAARLVRFALEQNASLVSGIPRQETGGLLDGLLVPLIHFVLLGYLPLGRMRSSRDPAYGAGCGQLFLANRADYFAAGGHRAIAASLHDGLQLPRAFRRAGQATDLCDATSLATCRMFDSAAETWYGLGRNASEGLAAPRMIVPATVLLLGGHVTPAGLVLLGLVGSVPAAVLGVAIVATALSQLPRWLSAFRFEQPLWSAALHPAGVLLLVARQWQALALGLLGRPARWRERSYPTSSPAVPDIKPSQPGGF